jgi:hypothetical protein
LIQEADYEQNINFCNKSRGKYWGEYQNHFLILDDGNTYIGIKYGKIKQIITENITNNSPPDIVAEHEMNIFSLFINETQDLLWAGGFDSIFQYCRGPANSWKIQAKYSGLGIGYIHCFSRLGNLLFAGGSTYNVCVVNTADKQVFSKNIKTAIEYIYSIQICEVSASEIYLTVTGDYPSYSDNNTDIFNVGKFKEIAVAKKIFSKPQSHIYSIYNQFNHKSTANEPTLNSKVSKFENSSHKKA